jgi:hypothetical protein
MMCFSINSSFFFTQSEKKKNKNTNAHQHAYSRCRLRLSALSATHKRKKKKKILFFFSSNNANDDTTFTSNWLLGSIFLFLVFLTHEARENEKEKERAPLTGLPVHVANIHETNAARAAKKSRKKSEPFFLFFRTAPPWSVLEAIAHSPCYHTRGRCCCTAHGCP